ncbi:hypothetical protein FS749_014697 [Ceratobasidium sp. UAMH 11750]|nr:hypothetical protein FS749_014697 [Ceratobasidium sp. UAMH 11750]
MGSQMSWAPTGARQVSVIGTEEKRAFTLMVGVSLSGQALPLQAIYAGKTARSLPDDDAPYMDIAQDRSFRFEYSGNTHYWATQQTMRNWVINILVPYFLKSIEENGLPPTQRCILQIDLWAVHRSQEFRSWMAANYPWIVIHYVPGGCTGHFQACDLLLNRALKVAIQQACHEDVVEETLSALEAGILPTDVRLDSTVKTLRNRSVRWLVLAHEAINRAELVQKAFTLCAVPNTGLNLSYDSLTSHEARQALLNMRTSDPDFYAEISLGKSTPMDKSDELIDEDAEEIIPDDHDFDISPQDFQSLAIEADSAADVAALGVVAASDNVEVNGMAGNHNGKRLRSGRCL